MIIHAQKALLPDGFHKHINLEIHGGRFTSISSKAKAALECEYAVPGLIDQHLHGGHGADCLYSKAEDLFEWLHFLFRSGTTQVVPTLSCESMQAMRAALTTLKAVIEKQAAGAGGAFVAGIHLEGPFLSTEAPGAMLRQYIVPPSIEFFQKLTKGFEDIIRLVTLAPEVPNALPLSAYIRKRGITVQAGHTAATAANGVSAFHHGIAGICHFFNAATPIHQREPGILTEALLNNDIFCECICDAVHVHPSAIQLLWRMKGKDRMIVVSDAVRTAGIADGTYDFDGVQTVIVRNGESRIPEGNLFGGSATLLDEIKELISIGIPAEDAFVMASATPATYLGIEGGQIKAGARADLLCLDAELKPVKVVYDNHST